MGEFAGWVPEELPASVAVRELAAEIMSRGPEYAERQALRLEDEAKAAAKERVQESVHAAEIAAWTAWMTGRPASAVKAELERSPAERAFSSDERDRRNRAVDILRRYGLEDVITGGYSGVVLDANIGVLEPAPDASRAARLEEDRQLQRSLREAEEGRAFVERIRARRAAEVSRSRPFDDGAAAPQVCSRAKYERDGYCGCLNCATYDQEDRSLDKKITGLMDNGYSLETARLACTPVSVR